MSTEAGWPLIATGSGLVVVGMAMLWAAKPHAQQRCARVVLRPVRRLADLSGALTCTSVAGGAIAGVQWAVLSQTGPGAVWAAVLGLPAFLAGATVARLFIVLGRQRQVRAALRRRRGSR